MRRQTSAWEWWACPNGMVRDPGNRYAPIRWLYSTRSTAADKRGAMLLSLLRERGDLPLATVHDVPQDAQCRKPHEVARACQPTFLTKSQRKHQGRAGVPPFEKCRLRRLDFFRFRMPAEDSFISPDDKGPSFVLIHAQE